MDSACDVIQKYFQNSKKRGYGADFSNLHNLFLVCITRVRVPRGAEIALDRGILE